MDPERVFVSLTEFAEAQSFLFSDPLRGKDQKKDSSLNGKFDVIRSGKLRLSIKNTVLSAPQGVIVLPDFSFSKNQAKINFISL